MANSAITLFLYGTLMRGEVGATHMAGARFLGVARTVPGWGLLDLGGYPGLVPRAKGVVAGELYLVEHDHLMRLDAFEEVPTLYRRATVALAAGQMVQTYLPVNPTSTRLIPSGDWKRHPRKD